MAEIPSAHPVPPDRLSVRAQAGLSAEERIVVRRCLAVLGVLGTCSLIGVASSLYLSVHYPLFLIALSPLGRHLILITPTVDPLAFVAVGMVRRMAFYIPCFYLGRALGPTAIDYLEARVPRAGRFYRWLERLFNRASHLVVFLFSGPGMSTIAGSSGMRSAVFLPLVTLGLIFRMLLVLGIAEYFREAIEALLALIEEYWLPGTIVLVVAVGFFRWRWRSSSDWSSPADRNNG